MRIVATDELHARAVGLRAKHARRWLFGFLLLLILLTHIPNPFPHCGEPEHWDKLVHFGLYATLAGLALRVVTWRALSIWGTAEGGGATFLRCAGVLVCVVAFGLLDEATQPFTSRDFDWFDWLADGTGALCGILCYEIARRRLEGVGKPEA